MAADVPSSSSTELGTSGQPSGQPVVPRDASTLILVRDRLSTGESDLGNPGSIEVCMVLRRASLEFAAGAYVFPGGKVEAADASEEILAQSVQQNEASPGALTRDAPGAPYPGPPSGEAQRSPLEARPEPLPGIAFFVAALRECFEETGILLASQRLDRDRLAAARQCRRDLLLQRVTFAQLLKNLDVTLALDALHYYSRWITPAFSPQRFDTRFFVAVTPEAHTAPEAHEVSPDRGETVAGIWITPAEAARRHRAGEIELLLPTVKHLEYMAEYRSIAELEHELARPRDVAPVEPRVTFAGDDVTVLLPGEPGFDTQP